MANQQHPTEITVSTADDLHEILAKTKAALNRLVEGDSEPYKAQLSEGQDVTVFGAIGGYERGSDSVKQQTEFVASRFHGGQNLLFETLATGVSGDLAYGCCG